MFTASTDDADVARFVAMAVGMARAMVHGALAASEGDFLKATQHAKDAEGVADALATLHEKLDQQGCNAVKEFSVALWEQAEGKHGTVH